MPQRRGTHAPSPAGSTPVWIQRGILLLSGGIIFFNGLNFILFQYDFPGFAPLRGVRPAPHRKVVSVLAPRVSGSNIPAYFQHIAASQLHCALSWHSPDASQAKPLPYPDPVRRRPVRHAGAGASAAQTLSGRRLAPIFHSIPDACSPPLSGRRTLLPRAAQPRPI